MGEVYFGTGEAFSPEELDDFLNYVFGFNGKDRDFAEMFPQIHRPEAKANRKNLVAAEDGRLLAAVGSYPRTLIVGEERLSVVGIGNVAVHPRTRGRGYMKRLMADALEAMIREGADLSDLGGQRQRYQHFGYEVAGAPVSFRVSPRTAAHYFRGRARRPIAFLPLREGEREDLWDQAYALYEKKLCRIDRSRKEFPLILRTHYRQPQAVLENGRFLGYFTGELGELTLADPADLGGVVCRYAELRGEVTFPVAPWEKAMLREAASFAEEAILAYHAKINVFHFGRTVRAFLKLKASLEKLVDGEMILLIHGFAGGEKLRITVAGGVPAVAEAAPEAIPDAELGQLEAIRFFFGVYSPEREEIPLSRDWFPLPFAVERADHV